MSPLRCRQPSLRKALVAVVSHSFNSSTRYRSHAELHPPVFCPARDNTQGQGLRFDYFLGPFYHGLRQVCNRECTHAAINDIK